MGWDGMGYQMRVEDIKGEENRQIQDKALSSGVITREDSSNIGYL